MIQLCLPRKGVWGFLKNKLGDFVTFKFLLGNDVLMCHTNCIVFMRLPCYKMAKSIFAFWHLLRVFVRDDITLYTGRITTTVHLSQKLFLCCQGWTLVIYRAADYQYPFKNKADGSREVLGGICCWDNFVEFFLVWFFKLYLQLFSTDFNYMLFEYT